ncbi:MAG: FHA domain-containing protein [Myxococcota bacterium]
MTVQSYLTSWLAMREATLGEKFAEAHAGWWLVWEPGSWKPNPGPAAATLRPATAVSPTAGDALCFQLGEATPGGRTLRLGRDLTNDLVIDDGTVSRHHLTLRSVSQGWELEAVRDLSVDDQPVSAGRRLKVHAGARVTVGGVQLTLHGNADLRARLKAIVAALK